MSPVVQFMNIDEEILSRFQRRLPQNNRRLRVLLDSGSCGKEGRVVKSMRRNQRLRGVRVRIAFRQTAG